MPVIGSGVCSQIKLSEISNIITWPLQTGFKCYKVKNSVAISPVLYTVGF